MRDHMRPMHNQADDKIYESEQRENTKRHINTKRHSLNYPFFVFSQYRKSQVVFQAAFQAVF